MSRARLRLALGLTAAGVALTAVVALAVVPTRNAERDRVRQDIVDQDAEVLYPEALQQLAESETAHPGAEPADLLWPVLKTADQKGMLAVTIFDAQGEALQHAPASLLLPEIPAADFAQLLEGGKISHYHEDFPLGNYFSGMSGHIPVLEVLVALTLPTRARPQPIGFAQYYIDATKTSLASQLAQLDREVNVAMERTLAMGILLITAVLVAAYFGIARAQRLIEERNERLVRANFELTLAAKVSALGQITTDLIHGLQGPVAGLRAVTAARSDNPEADWRSAADYAERLQVMIQDTVALLSDVGAQASYEVTGAEIADLIRRRNERAAKDRGVSFGVIAESGLIFDSRRGSLISLVATNLAQNAIAATPAEKRVLVTLRRNADRALLTVADEGCGLTLEARTRLFEPGRSGRPGGTGLGLAISRLLARHLGGDLTLDSTSPTGTLFRLEVPVAEAPPAQNPNSTITGQ